MLATIGSSFHRWLDERAMQLARKDDSVGRSRSLHGRRDSRLRTSGHQDVGPEATNFLEAGIPQLQ